MTEIKAQITKPVSLSQDLTVGPHLLDHHFMGRGVLPAVCALQILARAAAGLDLKPAAGHTTRADFLRFLYLSSDRDRLPVITEFSPLGNGAWRAALLTEISSKSGTMTRRREHVSVMIEPWPAEPPQPPPLDILAAPSGFGLTIPVERVYGELVPFGPAFQNLTGRVHLTASGASGLARAPEIDGLDGPLGSPFPVDAGFHLACLWGQRHAGILAFPTAYDRRLVFDPTRPGETYFCRVFPHPPGDGALKYDLWLLDREGRVRETVLGLTMKDVSGGRMKPPSWIIAPGPTGLSSLAGRMDGLCLLEIDAVPEFAARTLSPREKARCGQLGEKRRKSFTAARLALKRLSRELCPDLAGVPADVLDTLAPDGLRPALAGKSGLYCSATHDKRLTAAAAAKAPLGIDLEQITEKAHKGRDFFMTAAEKKASDREDPIRTAVLIWTVKEAAAKLFGLTLGAAMEQVEVVDPGREASRLKYNGQYHTAYHADLEDHLLTLLPS